MSAIATGWRALPPPARWGLVAAAGAGLFELVRRWFGRSAAVRPAPLGEDLDALARVLIVETGNRGSEAERAGVVWVALNRARLWQASVRDVVYSRVGPPKYPRKRSPWNLGAAFIGKLDAAHTTAAWPAALAFVQRVVAGDVPNPIGPNRILFVHHQTQLRLGRKLPSWIVARSQGGTAADTGDKSPLIVGAATFAGQA